MKQLGFTLIELLIVIGILSVLVITILVTLNPSEAQKKTRDTKRMKDIATLQAIIEQYINDGKSTDNIMTNCLKTTVGGQLVCTTEDAAGKITAQPCNSNWIGVNLCDYTKTVPRDPRNATNSNYACCNLTAPEIRNSVLYYIIRVSGSDYKIGVLQESKSNIGNVLNEGGTSLHWVEVASSSQAMQTLW